MLFTGGMAMTMMDTAYVLSSLEVEGEAEVAAVVVAVVVAAAVVVVVVWRGFYSSRLMAHSLPPIFTSNV